MTEALEVASSSMAGLAKALTRRNLFDGTVAKLSPEAARALKTPNAQRWWPGSLFQEVNRVVIRDHGIELYTQLTDDLVRRSLGPIAEPMVRVTLALVGATPVSLLSRMSTLAAISFKGPTVLWEPKDAHHGRITVKYLAPLDAPPIVAGWKATFQYLFDLTKPGTIDNVTILDSGATFVFDFSW